MSMMKETLVSICSSLNKYEIEYLVIGGVAVIYHGYTRATADVDSFKTEFLPTLAGDMSFTDAKKNAESIELDGVNIPIIGYDDLIRNKTLTNRLKDQADMTN